LAAAFWVCSASPVASQYGIQPPRKVETAGFAGGFFLSWVFLVAQSVGLLNCFLLFTFVHGKTVHDFL